MDLKSIINTDSTHTAPPRQSSVQELSSNQNFQYQHHRQQQQQSHSPYEAPTYQGVRHDIRPPQPPPLQHPPHHDVRSPTRSMSHQSIQSPYANTPTSSLNGNQFPFPHPSSQNTVQGAQGGPLYTQRDRTTTVVVPGSQTYGQPSPALLTPTATTPGSNYGYQQPQRPQSSHSSMTPTSAQSHIQNFPRDSPHSTHTNPSTQPPRYSGQHYQSQPGTPLGPPPAIGRPSPSLHREGSLPYPYDHHRSQSGSSYVHLQGTVPSPIAEAPGPIASSPVAYNPRQTPVRNRSYRTDEERERSLSVSPKTRLPSQTKQESFDPIQDHSRRWSEHMTSVRRTAVEPISEEAPPHGSHVQQRLHHPLRSERGSVNGSLHSVGGSLDEHDHRSRDYAHNPTQIHPIHPPPQIQSPGSNPSIGQPQTLHYQAQNHQGQNSSKLNDSSPTILHSSTFPTQYATAGEVHTSQPVPSSGSSSVTSQRQLPTTSLQVNSSHRTPPSQTSPTPPPANQLNTAFSPPMSVQTNIGLQHAGMQYLGSSNAVNSAHQIQSLHHTPSAQTSPTPPSSSHANTNFPPPVSSQTMQSSNAASLSATVAATPSPPDQASRKRKRYEAPIYAQKARGNPLLPNKRPAVNQLTPVKQEHVEARVQGPNAVPPKLVKEESNGHAPPIIDMPLPRGQPNFNSDGPLGPWEPSILDIVPAEELTRTVADFLYTEVVMRDDIAASAAGAGPGRGIVLEIEAKLGQVIDRNTDSRLRLPVLTECVLGKNDPSLRTAFKSAMTESQHRSLNGFLNEALKTSLNLKKPNPANSSPPPKLRIPMSYVHTRERDAFYELSQAGELSLPPFVRAQLNPRHNKVKVRITTDQKTGKELAKIIKVRIADLDIYSPKTPFDWRISVNLEMAFEGDMRDLVETQEGSKRQPDRNKDRMTYKHLAYQIDLTQVTPAEVSATNHKSPIIITN